MNNKILKRGSLSNGRGYCGHHLTWDNKKVFCRSQVEKIQCLLLDEVKAYYLLERQIFDINDIKYKPDFFIYSDKEYKNLLKIIEIKDTRKKCNTYESLYKEYFEAIGISYEAKTYEVRKFKKDPKYSVILEEYINGNDTHNMQGTNNPAFGLRFDTRRLESHSNIMKEVQNRPEVREKHRVSMKEYYKNNPQMRERISERRKKCEEQKRLDKYGTKKINKCLFCEEAFETYDKLDKQFCNSRSCIAKWANYKAKQNGYVPTKHSIESNKQQMMNLLLSHGTKALKIYGSLDQCILLKYKEEYCRLKSRFSLKSIEKYYLNIDIFIAKVVEINEA